MAEVVERQTFESSRGERCGGCVELIGPGAVVVVESVFVGELENATRGERRVCLGCASRRFVTPSPRAATVA